VKIGDCRVLTVTAENEARICKGKSVGEQWSGLCVVIIFITFMLGIYS
jgi:RNA polymerase subunit RPABC4/transcription elongation factor Spt4